MANNALQFDGTQNYLPLTTLGSMGSKLAVGFYCQFQISTSATGIGEWGVINAGSATVALIRLNADVNELNSSGKISVLFRDELNTLLIAGATSASNFNNGSTHTIQVTANFGTQTITIAVDGSSLALTYGTRQTLTTFANFGVPFTIGARNSNGTIQNFMASTVDNFRIGLAPTMLYGSYPMDEGTGSTTADISGRDNTATLTGSPLPTWVSGFDASTLNFSPSRTRPRLFAPGNAR